MLDELRSLDAKFSRALGAMCKRHGEQKAWHIRPCPPAGSFIPGQIILRKVLQSVRVDNFNDDTWVLTHILRTAWLGGDKIHECLLH